LTLQLLSAPASTTRTVTVTSSDPAVAQVLGTVTVPAGSQSANVQIQTGSQGVATLTFNSGTDIRTLTIVVGTPPASMLSPTMARPVGLVLLPPLSAGRMFTPVAGQQTVNVRLLSAPAGSATPVTVTSSNTNVATVAGPVTIAAGAQSAAVTVQTGVQGTATLTFVVGSESRQLTVVVGTPPAGLLPVVTAEQVGLVVLPQAQMGKVFTGVAAQSSINVPLLDAAAGSTVPVTVTTSDSNVANINGGVVIPAGSRAATLNIVTGSQGVATLTLTAAGKVSQIVIVVGAPPPGLVPTVGARPVGVQVKP
jgi:hypothetical protein